MKTAIILGATGLTGGVLLQKLLADKKYKKIKLFSRNPVGYKHPKIVEYLVDMLQLELHREDFIADQVFCCIGTTKSKTPDKEKYKAIDFGIPVAAADLCEQNNIHCFMVMSALGANPNSTIFYSKVKGEMEKEVLKREIRSTYLFQPSLISGERNEKRAGEGIAKKVMKVIDPLLVGPLEKYRSISPEEIADAMIFVANNHYKQVRIKSNEIKKLAAREDDE